MVKSTLMQTIETISSRENQRLVALRKVRDGKDRTRVFIEGRRLVADVVRSGIRVGECFFSDGFSDGDLLDMVSRSGARMAEVPGRVFPSIADTNGPQGIVALAERPNWNLDSIASRIITGLPVVIWLKEPNNPANLGAILRTAEASGAAGVLISPGGADAFSPKAVRGSMGSVFRLPVVANVEFALAQTFARQAGLITTAVDIAGEMEYTDVDWTKPRLLTLGSEAHGLSHEELEAAQERIVIPMNPPVESLNLAMAAGIILFEARRQNG